MSKHLTGSVNVQPIQRALEDITIVCLSVIRYIKPFWMVLGSNLATVFYVYLFVPETIAPDPDAKFLSVRHYKTVWWLLSSGGGAAAAGRRFGRAKLLLYLFSSFVVLMVHVGSFSLYVLYELSPPLCWSSSLIGYGLGILDLANLFGLVVLKATQRCLEESWVALIGQVSSMTGMLVFSLADTTALMFTGEHQDRVFSLSSLVQTRHILVKEVTFVKFLSPKIMPTFCHFDIAITHVFSNVFQVTF